MLKNRSFLCKYARVLMGRTPGQAGKFDDSGYMDFSGSPEKIATEIARLTLKRQRPEALNPVSRESGVCTFLHRSLYYFYPILS